MLVLTLPVLSGRAEDSVGIILIRCTVHYYSMNTVTAWMTQMGSC
jgi:hypothetical protein